MPLEQEYAKKNMGEADFVRYRRAIANCLNQTTQQAPYNPFFLFERKV